MDDHWPVSHMVFQQEGKPVFVQQIVTILLRKAADIGSKGGGQQNISR